MVCIDTWYWMAEYGKVFFAYLFFMFIWPSIVFEGHLKEKSKRTGSTSEYSGTDTGIISYPLSAGNNCWVLWSIFSCSFEKNYTASNSHSGEERMAEAP